MDTILIALLSLCFGNDVCEYQMRDCMTPYIRSHEGKKLYSIYNFHVFKTCYWGNYIPQDFEPGDELPTPHHGPRPDFEDYND